MVENASGQPDSLLMQPALNEQEKALRDLFVNEYLKDFDIYQAALRVGFLQTFAMDWAKKLFAESYVQQRIAQLTRTLAENDPEQQAQDRALVENTLRQAMQNGPYANRVQAARAFAEMRGWAKPDAGADAEQSLIDLFKDFAQRAPV